MAIQDMVRKEGITEDLLDIMPLRLITAHLLVIFPNVHLKCTERIENQCPIAAPLTRWNGDKEILTMDTHQSIAKCAVHPLILLAKHGLPIVIPANPISAVHVETTELDETRVKYTI